MTTRKLAAIRPIGIPAERNALNALLIDLSIECATLATIKRAFDASPGVDGCDIASGASLALHRSLQRLEGVRDALDRAIVNQ